MACFVPTCKSHSSRSRKEGQHISFHHFPIEKNIKEKWIENIGRPIEHITKYSKVCSKHFLHTSFTRPEDYKRRKLLHGAVPTLLLECDNDVRQSTVKSNDIRCQVQNQPLTFCSRPLLDVTNQKPFLPIPKETYWELLAYIKLLEKKLERVKKTSQQRLLKIKALRQQNRRLKSKIFINY